jgi:hypothetical protein
MNLPYVLLEDMLLSSAGAAAVPLVLTASSPTIFQIIQTTKDDKTNTSWALLMNVLRAAFTYILPCLWLWIINQQQHAKNSGATRITDAVFTAVLWSPLSWLLSQWPQLVMTTTQYSKYRQSDVVSQQYTTPTIATTATSSKIISSWLQFLIKGGPFGKGCSKIIHVAVAFVLWIKIRGTLPPSILNTFRTTRTSILSLPLLTDTYSWFIVLSVTTAIVILSLVVNIVLYLWSHYTESQGSTHHGLNSMLQPTVGRRLRTVEHLQLALLAVINATCEEFTCRGFWRYEFETTTSCTKFQSNIVQGMIFGLWHYFGIPNGWMGVILTTIYGWIMGYLSDLNVAGTDRTTGVSCLFFPIIAHSIADYYIFTVLSRHRIKRNIN